MQRGRDIIGRALAAGASALDEREAKTLLAEYGIPTPRGVVAATAEEAVSGFRALGRPVVLKALGAHIQHKSDRGLVVLGVRDEASVRFTFLRLAELCADPGGDTIENETAAAGEQPAERHEAATAQERPAGRQPAVCGITACGPTGRGSAGRGSTASGPTASGPAVLVEEMIPHERELLVGMRRDEQYGPVVAFGLGGIFTEALRDVAFALAPLDDLDAAELIDGMRAQAMLGPLRGLPAVDRAELVRILRALGRMALDHPQIAEIDVNPLLVSGASLVAADALVVLDRSAAGAGAEAGASAGAGADARRSPAGREARAAGGPSVPAPAESRSRRLDVAFAPRAVAVVGASNDTVKWGGSLMRNIIDGGYEGTIYPVRRNGGTVLGLPAVTSVNELPAGEVDLALVAVGADQATGVVEACGRRGIPAVMVIAAGYSEAGRDGVALEQKLIEAANAANITLLGPNCMGLLANSSGLNAVGFIALRPGPGAISVVSQSGNIGTQFLMASERRGVGIEKYIGVGNQALTDAGDVLAYLADDEHTKVAVIYVEGLNDERGFYEVARRTTPRKPVVVLRGGMTAAGRRAASSHTGAMAGSAEVFKAAARQAGLIVAGDADECLDIAACLAHLPLPRGRRVAVVTLGGGWGVLTADALAAGGMELAELPADLMAELDELLPPYWSHGNPVDLVASLDDGVPERIIAMLADCDAVDAVVALALIGSPVTGRAGQAHVSELNDAELALLEHIVEVMDASGKPVISVPLAPVTHSVFAAAGEHKPVVLPTPTAAVRALAAMASYAHYREQH